jgi:hypothetical protein
MALNLIAGHFIYNKIIFYKLEVDVQILVLRIAFIDNRFIKTRNVLKTDQYYILLIFLLTK